MSNALESTASYAYAELDDESGGITYEGLRVTLASKLAYERTARNKGWKSVEANPFSFSAYLAWHAGKLAGKHELTWEEFERHAIDAGIDQPDDDENDDDPDRPTDAANSITPQ